MHGVSVTQLIQQALEPLIRGNSETIHWELDIDVDLPSIADQASFLELVHSLVLEALQYMPAGGELNVTACRTASGWDLEVADSGPAVEERPCNPRLMAATLGAKLQWQNCPQGGGAVTAHFVDKKMLRTKAA